MCVIVNLEVVCFVLNIKYHFERYVKTKRKKIKNSF